MFRGSLSQICEEWHPGRVTRIYPMASAPESIIAALAASANAGEWLEWAIDIQFTNGLREREYRVPRAMVRRPPVVLAPEQKEFADKSVSHGEWSISHVTGESVQADPFNSTDAILGGGFADMSMLQRNRTHQPWRHQRVQQLVQRYALLKPFF